MHDTGITGLSYPDALVESTIPFAGHELYDASFSLHSSPLRATRTCKQVIVGGVPHEAPY